ncbi:MAG: hypothetical protein JW822_02750 [Spirochaetales bacterium]|nr:hypothetical protein [Spirochaetales bacterium]
MADSQTIKIDTEPEKILDVEYAHIKFKNKSDLYLTKYGLPFVENLKPENFILDKEWFDNNSVRLSGTSCTYKVKTKSIAQKSIDIVIKYNRMGQDIPGAEHIDYLGSAEFNSPFEEFSLVMELRNSKYESKGVIITQKPLAIYVPQERLELWQVGRRKYKMQSKIEKHNEVILDMFRPYIVIYEWIKGIDAVQAYTQHRLSQKQMEQLTVNAERTMRKKGFIVRDRKPHHIIIRPQKNGNPLADQRGNILYAVVDYELLERTPERDKIVKKVKRINYLKRQTSRFSNRSEEIIPPHLKHVTIFGVDYIYGHCESTNGALWVVGRDPYLFDYFLPERWEKTPRTKLSVNHEIYHTVTKDNINVVWKVSKVGYTPEMDPFKKDERKIIRYGYNSPFEEISIAIYLSRHGIRTIFPRAIYKTGTKTAIARSFFDGRRYKTHSKLLTPHGDPLLQRDKSYLLIWGYWNGPDEKLAVLDGDYYKGINALDAYRNKEISLNEYILLIKNKKERLAKVGVEDLNLGGRHLLLSLNSKGRLVLDQRGLPDIRICNFEFLKMKKRKYQ